MVGTCIDHRMQNEPLPTPTAGPVPITVFISMTIDGGAREIKSPFFHRLLLDTPINLFAFELIIILVRDELEPLIGDLTQEQFCACLLSVTAR